MLLFGAVNAARLKSALGGPKSSFIKTTFKIIQEALCSSPRGCVCVSACVYMCVSVNQVVHSDSAATLIHDSPPAVREFFTPFPVSARPELCCYRNIDSTKLNNADFLHPTWHRKLTSNSF